MEEITFDELIKILEEKKTGGEIIRIEHNRDVLEGPPSNGFRTFAPSSIYSVTITFKSKE